jgi:hypothetical protein
MPSSRGFGLEWQVLTTADFRPISLDDRFADETDVRRLAIMKDLANERMVDQQ